jgi:hypothetical protein
MDQQAEIRTELVNALERLGADPQLLAIVACWGDTLSDAAVLGMLRNWNNGTHRWARITSVERPKPTLTVVR